MKEKKWYAILPPDLVLAATNYTGPDYVDLAWHKEDALRVIDLLNQRGYEILGVEPWLPTRPGPTPLTFNWSIGFRPDYFPDNPAEFIRHFYDLFPAEAKKYLTQPPVFNFTVQDS